MNPALRDLKRRKILDIIMFASGIKPSVAVLIATVKALKRTERWLTRQ